MDHEFEFDMLVGGMDILVCDEFPVIEGLATVLEIGRFAWDHVHDGLPGTDIGGANGRDNDELCWRLANSVLTMRGTAVEIVWGYDGMTLDGFFLQYPVTVQSVYDLIDHI